MIPKLLENLNQIVEDAFKEIKDASAEPIGSKDKIKDIKSECNQTKADDPKECYF